MCTEVISSRPIGPIGGLVMQAAVGSWERPHPGAETILRMAKEYLLALAAPLDKSELHAGDFITGEA